MPDVVALDFEARAIVRARLKYVLDVAEGVFKHPVPRPLQIIALPAVLKITKPVEHGIKAEVHRSHVERRHLRLELQRRLKPIFHRHIGSAARGEVDHDIRAFSDVWEKLHEELRVLRRLAVMRMTCMQMHDGSTRLRGVHCGVLDVGCADGKIRRHGGRVNRTRHRAGDDDLLLHG